MKMHFVSTGPKFPYSYYIGIKSASKVGEVKLWYSEEPDSSYFDEIKVEKEKIECPDFPAFKGRGDHVNRVSKFDYLIWKIVSTEGGSVMGLDSITIRPFHDLLTKEILVGRDAETVPTSYCMHGATVRKGSDLAAKIFEDSQRALNKEEIKGKFTALNNGELRFGGAGIIPFLNNVLENPDKVSVADFGVLGGYMHDNSPFYLYEDSELLNPDCRTIPFYATWQCMKFSEISPESIKGSLLGRLVENAKI